MASYRLKRKTYSNSNIITGQYGLFDKSLTVGKGGGLGAGLNVGFAVLDERQHKKSYKETEGQMNEAVKANKNITSQLQNIAKS